jgi:hypothetical protein
MIGGYMNKTNTIYYNEDLLNNLKRIRDFIKKVKTQDYYVRGYEDARVIMLETLDIIITKQEKEI